MSYEIGEIWYAKFSIEEDSSKFIERPIIIADVRLPNLVVIKITKHDPRESDPYDVPIIRYKEAGLIHPSTAKISKAVIIDVGQVDNRKGALQSLDYDNIFGTLNSFLGK